MRNCCCTFYCPTYRTFLCDTSITLCSRLGDFCCVFMSRDRNSLLCSDNSVTYGTMASLCLSLCGTSCRDCLVCYDGMSCCRDFLCIGISANDTSTGILSCSGAGRSFYNFTSVIMGMTASIYYLIWNSIFYRISICRRTRIAPNRRNQQMHYILSLLHYLTY